MQIDFTGRIALVTGGTRGIGAAIVQALASAGAQVIATGSSAESIAKLAPATRVELAAVDLADPEATERFATGLVNRRLDILVNNAGINKIARFEEIDLADWDRIQRVNVRAPTVLCRAVVAGM